MSEPVQKCENKAKQSSITVYSFYNSIFFLFQLREKSRFPPKKFYNIDYRMNETSDDEIFKRDSFVL